MARGNLYFIFLLLFGVFVTRSFFLPGFIPTHDGEYHIIRLWQFDKVLRGGQLIPFWAPDLNNGYGVPLFGFFYPIPNYIGETIHLLGFSFIDSTKLSLAFSLIISSLAFYLWLNCFFSKRASFAGSIFYILAPYHLLDIFIRGSLGEAWAFAFAPLTLFTVTKLIKTKKRNLKLYFRLLAISLTLLILSHNILGAVFFFFALFYGIILNLYLKKERFLLLFFGFIFSLLLSAFFILTVIFEAKYTTGLKIINFKDHFPAFFQLIFPSWGSGFSVFGIGDGMSFQIGPPHILAIFLAFLLFFLKDRKNPLPLFFFIILIASLYLMLENSIFLWTLFSFLAYFQYPWRILSLVILISSFLVSYIIQMQGKFLAIFFVAAALFFSLPYSKPVIYEARYDNYYLENPTWSKGTATLGDSFSTLWFADTGKQAAKKNKIEIVSGKADVEIKKIKSQSYQFYIKTESPIDVKINTAYFPGWRVYADRKEQRVDYSNGLINFRVDSGEHLIDVNFEDTLVRKIGKAISLVAVVALFIAYVPKRLISFTGNSRV